MERGLGGLERVVLEADQGVAHVYLHGAQVTHFQPRDARPVLFVSRESHFEAGAPGKPIRGGVPICFPWFGAKPDDPAAPAHGFARLLAWHVTDLSPDDRGRARATLRLDASDYTRRYFAHDFAAVLSVTVDASLQIGLTLLNRGSVPMVIEEAFHSYFAVGDARRVSIRGLEGTPYLDKTEGAARKVGEPAPIAIMRETDRVYPSARGVVTIDDPILSRRIVVDKSGSATTVVWNPWMAKAAAMKDFGDDEWTQMACVETANTAENAVTIAPGESHTMSATIAVHPSQTAS
jgi:glucose-6-phosphate 1-epimerase